MKSEMQILRFYLMRQNSLYGNSWLEISFENISFWHYFLQHHSGTARTKAIQLCLWVHQQVCFDKIIINCCRKIQALTGNPCFNQLKQQLHSLSLQIVLYLCFPSAMMNSLVEFKTKLSIYMYIMPLISLPPSISSYPWTGCDYLTKFISCQPEGLLIKS